MQDNFPQALDDVTSRNFFGFTMQDTQAMVRAYEAAWKQSKELLVEIDQELGGD